MIFSSFGWKGLFATNHDASNTQISADPLRKGSRHGTQGQNHLERTAHTRLAPEFDAASVGLDQGLAQAQADAEMTAVTGACRIDLKKTFEYPLV